MKRLGVALLVLLTFAQCKKDEDQGAADRDLILKYISDNNLDAIEAEEGLFYVVEDEGSADQCQWNSTIKANYKGYLLDGTVFDEGQLDQFSLTNAIRGWQIGMAKFKENGSGILLIPSALGYGAQGSGSGSVPPNAVIIFDVELIKVY